MFPPARVPRAARTWRYLHSCSILSSAWARPLSEYWSVDWVRRPEVPFTVKSAPLRMASTMRASSVTFLIQAPSFWVYIANLAVPISAVASGLVFNGKPMMTGTSFFTLSAGGGGSRKQGWAGGGARARRRFGFGFAGDARQAVCAREGGAPAR